jgi:demethylmenaquinone methyltransferase/2-methoxy-6-polyprenyl-1,4-benzoquinol methylase
MRRLHRRPAPTPRQSDGTRRGRRRVPPLPAATGLDYGRVMVDDSSDTPVKAHARRLFAGLPAAYDRAGAALSFGQDPRWRAAMVGALDLEPGARVLDVAAGTGLVSAALRSAYDCEVVALDQSPEMLARATARFADDPHVTTQVGEAERLPFDDGSFDALTFTYLLRYVDDVPATLRELFRVVRPGGHVASLEFGVPSDPVMRVGWWTVTRVGLPIAGRLISSEWGEVGRFLGPNISDFAGRWPPERLGRAWVDAGMSRVVVRPMSFGAGIVMSGVRSAVR